MTSPATAAPCPPHPPCPHCLRHAAAPVPVAGLSVGAFSALCAGCCARLVRSARPLRGAQEAHLAAVTRIEGSPSREQIIAAIKAQDACPPACPPTRTPA